MNLNDLPDDVLIRLLDTAEPRDVARTKRLNKRFNQLVETFNLGKPRVKEFCVESRVSSVSPTKIGRIRLGPQKQTSKRRVVVTMRRERGVKRVERLEDPSCSTNNQFVQENMKKVVLQERLSFDGVTVDEEFYQMLTAKWNSLRHVTTFSLSLCHIRISWQQFADLLSRMTLRNLYLDFCTFDTQLISDKVIMALEHLEALQIQSRYPCFLSQLTDQTLVHWATREKEAPKMIQFRNGCASRMTLDGIRTLMMRSQPSPTSPKHDWDFGLLLEPTQIDSLLLSFILCPGWQVKVSDDYRARRIHLERNRNVLQFFIPAPFPTGPISAP